MVSVVSQYEVKAFRYGNWFQVVQGAGIQNIELYPVHDAIQGFRDL